MEHNKNFFISVTDKTGLEEFKTLTTLGYQIISTGGTLSTLEGFGIPCTHVEKITNFPEGMNGRLKTLHPNVFGGILADRSIPEHMEFLKQHGIEPIDFVAVNLYDFNGNPCIERIDIGGPSLIRAAAKNYEHVTVIVDSSDYDKVINEIFEHGHTSLETRRELALKAITHTAEYDTAISKWMRGHVIAGTPFTKQPFAEVK
jgi:phosphoribosylaminoimidazolecarboxamide formyltransferase/IMP cyclohydrolase